MKRKTLANIIDKTHYIVLLIALIIYYKIIGVDIFKSVGVSIGALIVIAVTDQLLHLVLKYYKLNK